MTSSINSLEYALRAIESIAFCLHAVLGITEPFTGCLRSTFNDRGAMPSWFWPVAGVILLMVASANFSKSDNVVLAAQAYIAAFHAGAVMYHQRLGDHPAAGVAPGFFIVVAFLVTAIRTNVLVACLGTLVCTAIAAVLCKILVTPPENAEDTQSHLLS